MNHREERLGRLKVAEAEYRAAVRAVALLKLRFRQEPHFFRVDKVTMRDVERLSQNLEETYLVRMFAEFETSLRTYCNRSLRRESRPPTKDLVEAIGARRSIRMDSIRLVQTTREFRNSLVHEEHEEVEAVTLAEARSRLCKYLSRLPLNW